MLVSGDNVWRRKLRLTRLTKHVQKMPWMFSVRFLCIDIVKVCLVCMKIFSSFIRASSVVFAVHRQSRKTCNLKDLFLAHMSIWPLNRISLALAVSYLLAVNVNILLRIALFCLCNLHHILDISQCTLTSLKNLCSDFFTLKFFSDFYLYVMSSIRWMQIPQLELPQFFTAGVGVARGIFALIKNLFTNFVFYFWIFCVFWTLVSFLDLVLVVGCSGG